MLQADTTWQYRDRLATAFDEVGILEEMGRGGWELTSFGPLALHFRRPEDPTQRTQWEYFRLTEFPAPSSRTKLEQDSWTYCGSWVTFHYFKRAKQAT